MDNHHTRRNAIINILGESLWGLKANLIVPSVILAVLLYQYGASPALIGAISAIETSTLLIPQLFGGYIFHSRARRKKQLVLWHYLAMLPFNILMGVLTLLANQMDSALYRLLMLACFACYTGAIGIVSASWFEYFIGTVYEPGIRGTVMGLSAFSSSILGTAGTLFAGWMLKNFQTPQVYAWLYWISWGIGMLSITVFLFIKDPQAGEEFSESPRPTFKDLAGSMRLSLAHSNFRRYLVGRTLAVVGFSIVPFIAIYFTSAAGGGLTRDAVVSSYSALTIASAVGSLIFGRLGDRLGHRWSILFGASMQVIALMFATLFPTPLGCILAYTFAGLTSSCAFVSHYNLVIEMCPSENRVAHISMANLLIGVPSALAPLAAGWIATEWSIPILFMICAIISLLAVVWFSLFFKEPRIQARAVGVVEPAP